MLREFKLPDLGEGLTESEIVTWRVAAGDRVELNQIIADVETAKAVVELPSPVEGVVQALHAEPGETIDVGALIVTFDVGRRCGCAGCSAHRSCILRPTTIDPVEPAAPVESAPGDDDGPRTQSRRLRRRTGSQGTPGAPRAGRRSPRGASGGAE